MKFKIGDIVESQSGNIFRVTKGHEREHYFVGVLIQMAHSGAACDVGDSMVLDEKYFVRIISGHPHTSVFK